jgi:hypothetical protein
MEDETKTKPSPIEIGMGSKVILKTLEYEGVEADIVDVRLNEDGVTKHYFVKFGSPDEGEHTGWLKDNEFSPKPVPKEKEADSNTTP